MGRETFKVFLWWKNHPLGRLTNLFFSKHPGFQRSSGSLALIARLTWTGWAGFRQYAWSSIVPYNLLVMVRIK